MKVITIANQSKAVMRGRVAEDFKRRQALLQKQRRLTAEEEGKSGNSELRPMQREGKEKMREVKIFENATFGKIRTIVIDDEPWFVGKDVATALGYSNVRDALAKHVDAEDKNTVAIRDGIQGNPNMTVINESGVYALVFGSKLPTARAFKRWVTHEVLPAIRKTGSYHASGSYMIDDPIERARAWIREQEERKQLAAANAAMQPKALFADAVSASETSILIGGLAKLIKQNGVDIGQKRLFDWLREHGFLIKNGTDKNMPTQRAMERGLFEVKEGSFVDGNGVNRITRTTKVTGKGQIYFVNRFLKAVEVP